MSPTPARINPFPGLRPFTQEEDYLFFGREEQTIELLQRLSSHRFVAVVGTSGSGKSSLVRCGLLSELLGGRMLVAGAAWEIAVTHPGGNPLALLTEALLDADLYDRQAEHARENLLATLSRSHFGLVEAVKQAGLGEGTNFLLVVDQFEEIFRFHEAGQRQQEAANEFVSLLLEAAAQKEVPIYIVLTMRSDFIGECGQFEGLAEMVNRGEFLIPRLNREQFKRVIEGPIKVAGGQIAPRLLQRLLNDLGQQADQLPCLQHALMRTWDVWAWTDETEAIDLDDYQRVGRMSQALSLHADEVYESLASDRQRDLCKGIFQALTVEESNNRGIRRPQRLGRLCQIMEVSPDELRPIIDAFRQQHVTFLMPSPDVELTEQTIIDISHESLMRVWTRLRQWVEDETQAAGIYHRLSESADLNEQGRAGLYRDPELGIALAWRESKRPNAAWAERYRPGFATAIRFLEASRQATIAEEQARDAARQRELQQAQQLAEAQRQRAEAEARSSSRLKMLLAATAVIAVFAVGASLVAVNFWREADRAKQAAELSEQSAKDSAITAQSEAKRATLQEAAAKEARKDSEENLTRARTAIDEFLVQVSDSKLLSTPGLQPLRAELLGSAGKFYEEFLARNPDDPLLRAGLADAFFRLGFVNDDLGNHEQALAALDKALKLQEAALQANPKDEKIRHQLARTWYEIARSSLGGDKYPEGDTAAKHAAKLWDELVREHPTNIDYSKSLARAFNILGNTGSTLGHPEQSFLSYQRSMQIRLDLLGQYPNDVEILHGLGESFNNIGLVITDPDQRLRLSERSTEFGAAAHRLSPQNVEYATDLTISYYVIASRLRALNRNQQALTAFHKSVDHALQFIRANPAVPAMRERLESTLQYIRSLTFDAAQADEYAQIFRNVRNTFGEMPRQTADEHMTYAVVQSDCARQIYKAHRQLENRKLTSEEEQELSALRTGSLNSIRQALAAGFKDAQRLRNEPLLVEARSLPEFATLIVRAEAAAKEGTAVAANPAPAAGDVNASLKAQIERDRAMGQLAFGLSQLGLHRTNQADQSFAQAVAMRRSLTDADPDSIQTQLELVSALQVQAKSLWNDNRHGDAQKLFLQQIDVLEKLAAEHPQDAAIANQLATAHRAWAETLAEASLSEQALEHYLTALQQQMAAGPTSAGVGTHFYPVTITLLLVDQPEKYRAACNELIKKNATSDPLTKLEVARLGALVPNVVEQPDQLLKLTTARTGWSTFDRGLVLYRAGKFEQAVTELMQRRVASRSQEFLADRLVLAMAHSRLGHQAEAEKWLKEFDKTSLQVAPDWARERHFLGIICLILRREANELIYGQPYSPAERLRRGTILAQLGDANTSQTELAAARGSLPDDPPSLFAYARALGQIGHKQQAIEALQGARESLTKNGAAVAGDVEFWQTCADACRTVNQPDEVTNALRRAVAAQSLRVIKSPQNSGERSLLLRLNDELAQALRATGHEAQANTADDDLKSLHAAFGLPAILRTVNDVFADPDHKETTSGEALAAVDRLIAAGDKITADNDPIGLHLQGKLHLRRAELLGNMIRDDSEVVREFAAARDRLEKVLHTTPDNEACAGSLAELLLKHTAAKWTILQPLELKSVGGATLTQLGDQSILASGKVPHGEQYDLTMSVPEATTLQSIRLEALAHDSLPNRGPGRARQGIFNMSNWEVTVVQPNVARQTLSFQRVAASYELAQNYSNVYGHWNISGWSDPTWATGRDYSAIWTLAQPVTLEAGAKLNFVMKFISTPPWDDQILGRLRLSIATGEAGETDERRIAAIKSKDTWAKLGAAYAVNGRNDQAAQYFGLALQRATDDKDTMSILQLAGRFDDILELLNQKQPDVPQLQLALARKLSQQGQNLLNQKQPVEAQTSLQKSREIFANLQANHSGPKWVILKPTEMTADGGESFAIESNGSIFVSGPTSDRAIYKLKCPIDLTSLTAIRLETIPDPRLPNFGAGRFANGNFHVAEMSASIVADSETSVPFGTAMGDLEKDGYSPDKCIDGNPQTYWDTNPYEQKPHWMMLGCKEPVEIDGGYLRITLDSGITQWGKHGLGHFRLSATSHADALLRGRFELDIDQSEILETSIALATAQAQQGQIDEAVASFTRVLALSKDRAVQARIFMAAPHSSVLEKLAETAAGNATFQAELARHYADRGQTPLAQSANANARSLLEQKLAADPENAAAASELGDLLLSSQTIIKPYWIDDETPPGVNLQGDSKWEFVGQPDHPVFSGQKSTYRKAQGKSQHYFDSAAAGLKIGDRARLFAYVYLDPQDPPKTVMLQFEDFGWDHRAIWGEDLIEFGTKGTPSHVLMGPLPRTGEWVRLEVDAEKVGLRVGTELRGWAFTQFGGTCHWDAAGCTTPFLSPWQKMAAAYHLLGDQQALDKLIARHPEATAGIGDLYALQQDWNRAIAEYDKAITPQTTDANLFAARAIAHRKLEHWEQSVADWGQVDLHALDKKTRYGNPSYPALEHRAQLHGQLQQFDKQAADYTELLKPERLGQNPWIFNGRGMAYDRLHQWNAALADYDNANRFAPANEKDNFQFFKALHFAWQGQWKKSADELRPLYVNPSNMSKEWWRLRDAALIFALAGDVENYRKTVTACYGHDNTRDPNPDVSKWTVHTMLVFPEMITNENRSRLMDMAGKVDTYWNPRLAASIRFRSGDDKQSAEGFDAEGPGAHFLPFAAMAHFNLGNQDRAKQLLEEANAWVQGERDKDPGAVIPKHFGWQDWAIVVAPLNEASDLILATDISPRKLAQQRQTERAVRAYLKSLAEAPDQETKSRIIAEASQFEPVVTELHLRLPDDQAIQNAYRRMLDRTATAFSKQLDTLNSKNGADLGPSSKLIASIIRRQDAVPEILLKLRPDDSLLHAGSTVLSGDWKQAAAHYTKTVDANETADSVARMVPPALCAYAGELGPHREWCQKMYEKYRDTTHINDIERTLKVMLLVDNGPELPPNAVKRFYDSFSGVVSEDDRVWFIGSRALLECRKGNYDEAHKQIDEALQLEKTRPNTFAKALALAVQSLTYAHQKDVVNARKALDQTRQFMTDDLKLKWKPDGWLDGSTILDDITVSHDKLIPEVIRHEAEKLIQSADQ